MKARNKARATAGRVLAQRHDEQAADRDADPLPAREGAGTLIFAAGGRTAGGGDGRGAGAGHQERRTPSVLEQAL